MKSNTKKMPKVLITCIDSWRGDIGANTLPSFFSKWDPNRVAVVYTRADKPTLPQCNHYFQISESEIIRAVVHPGKKVGQVVKRENNADNRKQITEEVIQERKRINLFRNMNLNCFQIARDCIWAMGAWKSPALDAFLEDFNPDVIFFPIYPYTYMNEIQLYIANKTGCRGVAYIADDNYSYKPEWYNPVFLLRRTCLRRTINSLMRKSDELLVILPFLEKEYSGIFNLPIKVLSKGIPFDGDYVEKRPANPISVLYTGNLFIGRDKTMAMVADTIRELNEEYGIPRIKLEIYSHIQYSQKLLDKLNIPGSSSFNGAVSVEESRHLQREADVVLFVEGIDIFNKNKARLSFSTKLTDYFRAGKCILAVGPRDIAPIDYLNRNDAAIVAFDRESLKMKLRAIVDNPQCISEYGRRAYELGINNHSENEMFRVIEDALTLKQNAE